VTSINSILVDLHCPHFLDPHSRLPSLDLLMKPCSPSPKCIEPPKWVRQLYQPRTYEVGPDITKSGDSWPANPYYIHLLIQGAPKTLAQISKRRHLYFQCYSNMAPGGSWFMKVLAMSDPVSAHDLGRHLFTVQQAFSVLITAENHIVVVGSVAFQYLLV
jgi:hypothetical protein